ncbi:MAG TPA: MFS transporter [Croceibacterium sp.]|nr:MFS transporter [Croceibacterium sp.]
MQSTFSAAIERAPMRPFQWLIVAAALVVLVIEGLDLQSLPIVTPLILADWGVDRALFGPALAAALFGMAFGSMLGGWLGDRWGRLKALYLAALIFGASTILAAYTHDILSISLVRVFGGLGFGAGYPNALALVNDWVPARLRTYIIATLSVGIPIGTAMAAAVVPPLLESTDWRGVFQIFGVGSIVIGTLMFFTLREAPSYLLARGDREAAQRSAALAIDPAIELLPEPKTEAEAAAGTAVGVFHASNKWLNWGIGISFAACTTLIYGLSSWATVFLTSSGFTLEQAAQSMFWFGILSMIGGLAAGPLVRTLGSRITCVLCAVLTFASIVALGMLIDTIAPDPSYVQRQSAALLVGVIGGLVSLNIATFYAVMAVGYPQSCRAAAIGFHLSVARVGVISMVFAGGWLLNLGGDSFVYYFAALAVISLAMFVAVFVVDRQIEPIWRAQRESLA